MKDVICGVKHFPHYLEHSKRVTNALIVIIYYPLAQLELGSTVSNGISKNRSVLNKMEVSLLFLSVNAGRQPGAGRVRINVRKGNEKGRVCPRP